MSAQELFQSRRLPARLTVDQAALLLGIHVDGIDHLVEIGLLEALGGAPRGVQRLFAAVYIETLGRDLKWLAKATLKIRQNIQQRNLASKNKKHHQHPKALSKEAENAKTPSGQAL